LGFGIFGDWKLEVGSVACLEKFIVMKFVLALRYKIYYPDGEWLLE